jgi:hypothetical protein
VLVPRDNNGLIDDLDQATSLQVRFRLPDGTNVTRTGYFFLDNLNRKSIAYDSNPLTDLLVEGNYEIQGEAYFGSSFYPTDSERFLVHPRI